MKEVKPKKSTFENVVILFNIISIILMVGIIIISLFMSGELSNRYGPPSLEKNSIQQFNGKFDIYEGVRTGLQIKQLVKTVNVNNINYDGTDRVISVNSRTNENQYTFNGDNARKYKVEIEYDNDLVNNINIYKSNTKNENKNISIDYTEFAEITGTMQEGSIGKVYNTIEKNIEKNNVADLFEIFIGLLNWFLIWLPIFLPFIIINIVVYRKCKSITKNMGTAPYNYGDIKERQKFLLLLVVFTDIAFCVISYFWLKLLEYNIIDVYSRM